MLGKEELIIKFIRSDQIMQGELSIAQVIVSYMGKKYVATVSSDLKVFHLSLIALGIKEGDKVILSIYTLEELVRMKRDINPNLVFIPSPNDLHQDHQTIAMEGMRAFKQVSILGYELPWNNVTFSTQAFIKLEKRHIEKKIEALKAYKSQSNRNYLTEDFIWSWAKTRGVQINAEYAESFEVIRWII